MSFGSIVRGVATWAGVVLVTALLCEVVLRVYNPVELPLRGTDIVLPANKHLVFENPLEDSQLDARIVVDYNGIGFRGPDPPPDFAQRYTIFTVGGSTTHSARQGNGKDWTSHVRNALDDHFANTWINNAGLEGHSTFGHIYLLEQFLVDLQPDMVMFLIGINDRGRDQERIYDSHHRVDQSLVETLVARSELLSTALVLWRVSRAQEMGLRHWEFDLGELPKYDVEHEDREVVLAEHRAKYVEPYRERVMTLVRDCRENGIEPALITQPALFGDGIDPHTGLEIGDVDAGKISASLSFATLELYNDVLREMRDQHGVFVVDLAREMPKDSSLFYDWVHFTNEGARVVGEIVARRLIEHLEEDPRVEPRS